MHCQAEDVRVHAESRMMGLIKGRLLLDILILDSREHMGERMLTFFGHIPLLSRKVWKDIGQADLPYPTCFAGMGVTSSGLSIACLAVLAASASFSKGSKSARLWAKKKGNAIEA